MTTKYPSRDLMYEWGRVAPEQLAKVADALDTKIIGVFITASIVITLMATLIGKIQLNGTLIPFIIAFACFTVIFGKSLRVWRVHWFIVADNPYILKEDYWKLDPNEAKEAYWEYTEKAFSQNYHAVMAKGRVLQWTIPLLASEVIALVAWLFLISFN